MCSFYYAYVLVGVFKQTSVPCMLEVVGDISSLFLYNVYGLNETAGDDQKIILRTKKE